MKLKLKRRNKNGKIEWVSGMYRGRGGISSLVAGRISTSLFKSLGVFSLRNFLKLLK